ncbi:Aste57867_20377 [Aphanomyces stellatus]|uniref:Aste57867_20377 protein n=1 Tax=Aphanomyces stellatus TaxID=120398 RepID=A0A485LES5_9STRA|nr:hypothetical protein As57867_020311 [Aphanomyces stellatus]VFT97063.1 Aste57867_20377 [Aphanomyces stellatus]
MEVDARKIRPNRPTFLLESTRVLVCLQFVAELARTFQFPTWSTRRFSKDAMMDYADAHAASFFASLDEGLHGAALEPAVFVASPRVVLAPPLSIEARIVDMLVPTMALRDVAALIPKIHSAQGGSQPSVASKPEAKKKPRRSPQHVCDDCGNIDQARFVVDFAHGDVVCMGASDARGCGNVVQDHLVFEGNAYRCFEGEADRSHHGPAPNPLLSSHHHLKTVVSDGPLRRLVDLVDINLSQMGQDDRRTRVGYKDRMVLDAVRLIDHAGANLALHDLVCARAKHTFARFRTAREHVHKFDATVAACLIDAFRTTQADSLWTRATGDDDDATLHPFACERCMRRFNAKRALQFHTCDRAEADRAAKRARVADV